MLRRLRLLLPLLLAAALPPVRAADASAAFEQQLSALTKSDQVTVVHLWAPWCSNCKSELSNHGWSDFIAAHPKVNFVFVTVWNPTDGHEVLAKNGVGAEPNFQLLLHPNGQRHGDPMHELLGLPVSWIPTTWVYKGGELRYALNYGELRFPMLAQLITDSSDSWDH